MTLSEVISIDIFYHYSGYKCFKYFYKEGILKAWSSYFPEAVSYNRFVELKKHVNIPLFIFMHLPNPEKHTGTYYIDSTKLPVCDNRRIYKHKVFDGIAQRGKTSMGWFYGLKLHMITNEKGDLMSFTFSSGNKADCHEQIIKTLTENISAGKLFADAGYISGKLVEQLIEKGVLLLYKFKKNMKNKLILYSDKWLLKKRTIIETIFDILKNIFDLWHSRHRSVDNAFNNMIAALAAYQFLHKKPSITTKKNKRQIVFSLANPSN